MMRRYGQKGAEGSGRDAGKVDKMDTGGRLIYHRIFDKGGGEKGQI